ncbi:uncharacterized, partial [Tachysurus ichikawai]
ELRLESKVAAVREKNQITRKTSVYCRRQAGNIGTKFREKTTREREVRETKGKVLCCRIKEGVVMVTSALNEY